MKTNMGLWIDHRKAVIVQFRARGKKQSLSNQRQKNSPHGLTGYVRRPPMNLRRFKRMVDRR